MMTLMELRDLGWDAKGAALFRDWMKAIDALAIQSFGLDTGNFEDWGFADAFEAGQSPDEAFEDWVEGVSPYSLPY